jgi:hypothetical protein
MAIALPMAPVAPVIAAIRSGEEELDIKSPESDNKPSLTYGYDCVNAWAFLGIPQRVKGIIEKPFGDK